jgi:surface polysaccharide O-acyltransferase-like enzyme
MKKDNIIKNYEWVDSLRVLATLSVIFVHVTAPILYQYGKVSNFDWWVGNIYDSTVRFCVPIFLMISGVLILSKNYENTGEYLRKRVLRILLPFLFWSIIYIAKDLFFKFNHEEQLSYTEVLKFIFLQLKNGASYHLWYIYLIIGLYLFFPIIGKWIRQSDKQEIKYFIGIWLITMIAQLPFVNKIVPNINITYFTGYIGFPILGYYLNKYSFDFNGKKAFYILSILTGIVITSLGTFFITDNLNRFDELFYGYLTPNVLLVSAGVFLLFKNFVKFGTKMTKIVLFFSKYSYGVYLIHVLVLMVLAKFNISYAFVNPIIGIPVTSILCIVVSTFIVLGINKLPFGKYISG